MKTILVVAPHADDETLGCGGTILKHKAKGDQTHWLLATSIAEGADFSAQQEQKRKSEVSKVATAYSFDSVTELGFLPAQLDSISKASIIQLLSAKIQTIKPNIVYIPYRGDVHSDHCVVFDSVVSATKSFRVPFIERLIAYETISETDFGLKPEDPGFRPNLYVDITHYISEKHRILDIYQSELGEFPFPRSHKAISALENLRGAQSGVYAAEAFMILKEVIK